MLSLADVLLARRFQLTGSDSAKPEDSWLTGSGVVVYKSHHAEHVTAGCDVVIYSDAIPQHNPELIRAAELGIPVLSYPQALGELTRECTSVAIAGAHGKSTTIAMLHSILLAGGMTPTTIGGGIPLNARSGGTNGREPVIVEACEFRENFLHLDMDVAALLNLDHDHVDCFRSVHDVEAAFERFVAKVNPRGCVVFNADDGAVRKVCQQYPGRKVTFGESPDADLRIVHVEPCGEQIGFQYAHAEQISEMIELHLIGRHQVQNAVAAAAVAAELGVSADAIRQGLQRFPGIRRRLEHVATIHETTIWDDFAHLPREIAAGISALREIRSKGKVLVIFQPHQLSRTKALLDEMALSLQNADGVAVMNIYAARETWSHEHVKTARELAAKVSSSGTRALHGESQAEIDDWLAREMTGSDRIVCMGAGDIGRTINGLVERIRQILASQ